MVYLIYKKNWFIHKDMDVLGRQFVIKPVQQINIRHSE